MGLNKNIDSFNFQIAPKNNYMLACCCTVNSLENVKTHFNLGISDVVELHLVPDCRHVSKDCLYLIQQCRPDDMPPYVGFYLGLHCLPKYLFSGRLKDNFLI